MPYDSARAAFSLIGALGLIFGAGQALFGQTATGNIVGRVTDSTEAVGLAWNLGAKAPHYVQG